MSAPSVTYTTGVDGFGDLATDEDRGSFADLVEARLQARFPDADVSVDVSARHLESRVRVVGIDEDEHELRSWIGVDLWDEWCGGARAEAAS